jgi:ribonuclease E
MAQTEPGAEGAESELAPRRAGDEQRRGRSRDRYGRDRRERGSREEQEPTTESSMAPTIESSATVQAAIPDQVEKENSRLDTVAPAHREPERIVPAPAAPAPAGTRPVPSLQTLPKVQPFELPIDELAQVAEGSGLHWVNSDAERVAQVRAAIAAEVPSVRVPRERPPAISIADEPLVLVETRRDLGAMVLPFEVASKQGSQPLQ